ncbi:MAG: hypothetical protein KGZ25_12685 [Planctomycetes bacterium]|nr:hypothetical protein [Planctomycetota bacterium]
MRFLITIVLFGLGFLIPVTSGAVSEKKIEKLDNQFDKAFNFRKWAGESGKQAIYHSNLNVAGLIEEEYSLDMKDSLVEDGYVRPNGYRTHYFLFGKKAEKDSDGKRRWYSCRISERYSVRDAQRDLCRQWANHPVVLRAKTIPTLQIGNHHFVSAEQEDPSTICFTRGNIVVVVSNKKGGTPFKVARMIDRRLQMQHLTKQAPLKGKDYTDGKEAPAQKVETGEKIVVAEDVVEKKKKISVVASQGKLFLNDKDQLVLDPGGAKREIKIWKVSRTVYNLEEPEEK